MLTRIRQPGRPKGFAFSCSVREQCETSQAMSSLLDRACPCGSGKLRRECDEAELAACVECGGAYHHHSNRHVRCEPCAKARRRAMTIDRCRAWREARRKERHAERDAREAQLFPDSGAREGVTKSPDQEVLTLL